ncbi:MAG: lipid-A-disaccharide synthase [Pseudomonadales bacterium]
MALTIGMVAGEASGDNLGGPLLLELTRLDPSLRVCGIGGEKMVAAGLESWIDMDRLSVNGFIDPLKRLPDLIRILLKTRDRMVEEQVDCFVGVDFNFFNLLLASMLHKRGIKTVHYVSPTLWAWRQGRIRRIVKSVDLMLTLYPFETEIYERHGVPVRFVGHPKADEIDPDTGVRNRNSARQKLGYTVDDIVVAVLPGSRGSEVKYSGPDFLRAATLIAARFPEISFVIPAANDRRKQQIRTLVTRFCPGLDIRIVEGEALTAMTASNVVLVNSGTATLEAMLLRRPMVMSYRLGPFTYAIVSRMVKTQWFALPNILAREQLVPELIQDQATPEALAHAVTDLLSNDHSSLLAAFDDIHANLRRDAAVQAAGAIMEACK